MFIYLNIYGVISINIHERKTELMEYGNFRLFPANGKWEMEVCFPWSANDKRANVPNYGFYNVKVHFHSTFHVSVSKWYPQHLYNRYSDYLKTRT
jgi:hypothetical protein